MISKQKIKISHIYSFFFLLIFSIYIFSISVSRSVIYYNYPIWNHFFSIIIKLTLIAIVGLSLANLIIINISIKKKLLLMLPYIYFLPCYFLFNQGDMLLIYSFIVGTVCIKRKLFFTTFFVITISSVLFIILLSVLKIIPDYVYRVSKHYSNQYRLNLGFFVPNCTSYYFISLLCVYFVIRNEKITYVEMIIIEILSVLLYVLTETRNCLFLTSVSLIIAIILKLNKNELFCKVFMFSVIFSYIFGAFLIILITIFYNMSLPFTNLLNKVLSGRLALNINAIKTFGIHLINDRIRFNTTNVYDNVDSGFFSLLISCGIINFLIIIFIMTTVCYFAYKKNNKWLSLSLLLISLFSIFDQAIIMIVINPFYYFFLNNLLCDIEYE